VNYDPNITWAKQRVKLTYTQWDATLNVEVEIGGNCKGFCVLEAAVDRHYEQLVESVDPETTPSITLREPNGDTLVCEDEEDQQEDWLKDLCVAAEIVAIEPEESGS
jgi:hypothetical protein